MSLASEAVAMCGLVVQVCPPHPLMGGCLCARDALSILGGTASLHVIEGPPREGGPKKQETPRPASQRVSTPATSTAFDGRAASAQCDTRRP